MYLNQWIITVFSSSTSWKSQNLTSLSALPVTKPFLSGLICNDQIAPSWASILSINDEEDIS